jgi:hypothetical protein
LAVVKPLQPVAMGLVIVVLTARAHSFDLLPDPLGWLLVIAGVRRVPTALPRRGLVVGLAVLAGVVSVPLWVPQVADRLYDTDPSLAWAATLPQLGFAMLFAAGLAVLAHRAGDSGAARWLRIARTAFAVVALLPVLVFGGGWTEGESLAAAAAGLAAVLLVVLLLVDAGRGWARAEPDEGSEVARE